MQRSPSQLCGERIGPAEQSIDLIALQGNFARLVGDAVLELRLEVPQGDVDVRVQAPDGCKGDARATIIPIAASLHSRPECRTTRESLTGTSSGGAAVVPRRRRAERRDAPAAT